MTFGQMKSDLYDELNLGTTTPEPAIVARIARWLNEGYKKLLREPGVQQLRMGTLPFTTIIGASNPWGPGGPEKFYAFAEAFERIDRIVDVINGRRLVLMTRDRYRAVDPDERVEGEPTHYVPEGIAPVQRQPQGIGYGTCLWARSYSGADTTQIVRGRGVTTDGQTHEFTPTLLTGANWVEIRFPNPVPDPPGIPPVDPIPIGKWATIQALTLSAPSPNSVIEFVDDTRIPFPSLGQRVLSRIPVGQTSVTYQMFRLWPTPSGPRDYKVDGLLKIADLVTDTDVPIINDSFHETLKTFARYRWYKLKGEFQRAGDELATFEREARKFWSEIEFPPDSRPQSGSADLERRSNLGGWYPADSGLLGD